MWIESHQSLARHPKLIRLAARLKINRPQAIGHLHLLWWWTLDYAPNGDVSAFASCEIAAAAEWNGPAEGFFEALKAEKWIDEDGTIHDWDEYAGKLLEKRKADAERKAAKRKKSAGCPSDVHGTAQVHNQPTVPTEPTNPPDGGAVPPAPPPEPPPQAPKKGAPKVSDAEFLANLKAEYTWLNVDAEIAKARANLMLPKNQGRQLTRRFILNWLNRCETPMAKLAKPKSSPLTVGEAIPDPDWWREYLADHPAHEGKHFAQLTKAERDAAQDWGFARNQGDWQAVKSNLTRTAA